MGNTAKTTPAGAEQARLQPPSSRPAGGSSRIARAALALAAVLILISWRLPYWSMVLVAPQYPQGLQFVLYPSHDEGDIQELDELNHYIGMTRLESLAPIERRIWPGMIGALALLTLTVAVTRRPWLRLLGLATVLYPVGVAVDLYRWLYWAGHHLDPHAALSSSIQPFTPPLFGSGQVGQFQIVSGFGPGYALALLAAVLVIAALALAYGLGLQARQV